MSEVGREEVRGWVDQAAEGIARCWPLRTFAYRNPLAGFEGLPFHEALRQGKRWFGGEGYLSLESYRTLYAKGRITDRAIDDALASRETVTRMTPWEIGSHRMEPIEILRAHLLYGIEGVDASALEWEVIQGQALTRYRADVPAETRKHPESVFIPGLWSGILQALGLSNPFRHSSTHDGDEPRSGSSPGEDPWRSFLWDLSRVGREQTMGEWIQRMTGTPCADPIDEQMIKWCSSFLDDGMADWSMPGRDRAFFDVWRDLARYDASGWFQGIRFLSRKVAALPDTPEETVAECLDRLGIGEAIRIDYLRRHLSRLPGWAGLIKWRAAETDAVGEGGSPIDLVQYLAVRLFYETEWVDAVCRDAWRIGGRLSEIQFFFKKHPGAYPLRGSGTVEPRKEASRPNLQEAWRLFHLAQFLGITPESLSKATAASLYQAIDLLNAFPTTDHPPLWLEALEASYRERLLHKLKAPRSEPDAAGKIRPDAQAVFCIDARSEGFRRHLESLGPYETFGFAGFFGVPICYRPYGSEEEQLLCPPLIRPSRLILERPRTAEDPAVLRHEDGARWHHLGHGLFHDLKANNLTAFVLIDFLGAVFGLTFIGKTFFPAAYSRLRERLKRWLVPTAPTELRIDRPEADDTESARYGFTLTEQAGFVGNGLRLMGLTDFARIVLLCAHGSSSENNPYAGAYDCGACGGNHGGPNARILAAMSNRPAVRSIVREQGLRIPEETVFIAGEHNTTTDQVTLIDADRIPASHQAEVARLMADLQQAGRLQARDRLRRLPRAAVSDLPEEASRLAAARGADWSEVRPEWGLSSNAAFIVGRRAHTEGIDLEGRVFLHSYDPEQDDTGRSLETIMTAPLLVVQWISMEYYFSGTDPWVYGSGSKVLHNVVGGVGVMLGRQGDLRPGLPVQSVRDGNVPYHEPMRPLVIIEAPAERIEAIIGRHAVLQRLFQHRWVQLVRRAADDGSFWAYRSPGRWEAISLEPMGVR